MSSRKGRGHGGSRQNAGRKSWREKAAGSRGQSRLGNFFPSPNNNSTSNNSSSLSSQTRRRPLPQQQQQQQQQSQRQTSSAPRQASQSQSTPHSTLQARSNIRDEPTPRVRNTSATVTQSQQQERNATPNFDADESPFDDSILHRGKKMGGENLKNQTEKMTKTEAYREKAVKMIKDGFLWDVPPLIPVKTTFSMKKRWQDFFQLKIFNWIPEAMLGDQWKPCCPLCAKPMAFNGRKVLPRLVYGLKENYWLNAPRRYQCNPCTREERKKPKKERKQTGYYSTSDEVLRQIGESNPELIDLFPCHLSRKNAIDKDLLDIVIDCAIKGIGPSAMAENILSWHQAEWQRKENMWACNVIQKLHQPSVNQQPILRSMIEKCPEYFSKELGGCTPTGKFLIKMFCSVIQKSRSYYDSEVIKRAITSKILAIDASYKVPKWIMKWGKNHRIFDALHSGTNEYNEIILQRFSTSDNHTELGSNLKVLSELGLNPYLSFSDDPLRDESLLHKHFSNLRNGSENQSRQDILPSDLKEMTTEKTILYLHSKDNALDGLSRFRNDVEVAIKNTSQTQVKLALDCEWPIYREGNSHHNKDQRHGDINIVQLGSNVLDYTLILELYNFVTQEQTMVAIGQKLRAIFNLDVSCITGCKQKADYTKLCDQYQEFDLPRGREIERRMDCVSAMAINRGLTTRGKDKTSLQSLCKGQGLFLKKKDHIRVGPVFASRSGSLTKEALEYCQLDVEAPLLLHGIYSGYPDLTKRLTRQKLSVGQSVDIMSESVQIKTPIAQGVIKQISGTWGTHNTNITSNYVLVEVRKVFNAKGVIHHPCDDKVKKKCKCQRSKHGKITKDCDFYLYSQYGKPSFDVLELKSRLRMTDEDMIKYPKCIYESEDDVAPSCVENFTQGAVPVSGADDEDDGEDFRLNVRADVDVDEASVDSEGSSDDVGRLPEGLIDVLTEDDLIDVVETNETKQEELTEAEVQMATDKAFNVRLEQLIQEADAMSAQNSSSNNTRTNNDEEKDVPIDDIEALKLDKTVLADIFHLMDRAKLPTHHEYKSLFFRCLRAAMFILNKDDVDAVKAVLQEKGISWEEKMAFDFDYIAKRVRRTAPPPDILYNRLKVVYDFFKGKIDSKTNKILFNVDNRKKFENVLELVKDGYASDPEHIALYVPKTDNFGRTMKDKDGLQLYRSLRGTSNLESLHQYLTTSFGHTIAGPLYSDSLLLVLRHKYNWRMSRKNRPGFPKVMHYDGRQIDRINEYYTKIYGYAKYRQWTTFNENLPLDTPYGIVRVEDTLTSTVVSSESDMEKIKLNPSLSYLQERQQSPLPFLPIRGKEEQKLVYQKLKEVVKNNESVSNESVFEKLTIDWNKNHLDAKKKIYPKMPIHFQKHVKQFRRNQDKRDAAAASGANTVTAVLEYVPEQSQPMENFEPASLDLQDPNNSTEPNLATPTNPTDDSNVATIVEPPNQSNLALLCQVCAERDEQPPKKKQRKRTCRQVYNGKTCPNPTTCKGRNENPWCSLYDNVPEMLAKRTKRKVTAPVAERRCKVCGVLGCPGGRGRSKCKNKKR